MQRLGPSSPGREKSGQKTEAFMPLFSKILAEIWVKVRAFIFLYNSYPHDLK